MKRKVKEKKLTSWIKGCVAKFSTSRTSIPGKTLSSFSLDVARLPLFSLDGARLSSFSFDLAKFSTSSIAKRLKFSIGSFTSLKNLISNFATSKEETIFILFGCKIHTT